MLLDIENSLSKPRAKLRPRLWKLFSKRHLKKNIHIPKLSTGLLQRKLLLKIAARWRYRLHIKNLTGQYNDQFCVNLNFCFAQEA